jgi:hypothetical protein
VPEVGAEPGRGLRALSWLATFVFAATAIPVALGVDAIDDAAVAVTLGLFLVSLGVWTWALVAAAVRTTRGDDVAVTTLFLVEGAVPGRVRWSLYGSLLVCLAIAAATAAANPFGVLVPMFPLGIVGLWGARHGTFPPRRAARSR